MSVEKAKPALFSPALMRAALDGSYALDEWRRLDGQPLLDGVFETNANVGIGGALFAGFAVPLFLESIRANTDRAADSIATLSATAFELFLAGCAMMSLGTAALAVRNATAAKLVVPDGAQKFLEEAGGALVMPMRLYTSSIACAVGGAMTLLLKDRSATGMLIVAGAALTCLAVFPNVLRGVRAVKLANEHAERAK